MSYVGHDALGRVASVVDNATGVTSYTYGPFGLVRTVKAPDQTVTTTDRDAWGRVTTHDDPDRGITTSHHDGFGDVTSSADALRGKTVTASLIYAFGLLVGQLCVSSVASRHQRYSAS